MSNALCRAGWAALVLVMSMGLAQGTFDATVVRYERSAAMQPNDPERWHDLAKIYSDKVQTDPKLPKALATTYIKRGLEHAEKALAINHQYYEALMLKSVLLRQQAEREGDPAVRNKLIALADRFRAIAAALR